MESKMSKLVAAATALVFVALIATIGASQSILAFRTCFGVVLFVLASFQLYLCAALFRNRSNTLLELAQPVGLAIFSLSGSIATLCALALALPDYDVACAMRQPVILTCITLMGSILVSRSWRISCIICPTLGFAASGDKEGNFVHSARLKLMGILTKLSTWSLLVGSCGRAGRGGTKNTIRKQVTFADSLRVTAILMVPQVILQIVNLCLPNVRMHSVEIDEGLYVCENTVGPWFLALGVVVTSFPFLLALLLNLKNVGMPDLFREYDQLATCIRASVSVLLTTLPTIAMIDHTISNAHAYLVAGSLMSFLLPLQYYIAFMRLSGVKKKVTKKQMKSQSAPTTASSGDDPGTLQTAENSATMAKTFVAIGRHEKAVEVRNGILSMFKKDGEYSFDTGRDQQCQTQEQHLTTTPSSKDHEKAKAFNREIFKQIMDAVSIYEICPSKKLLKDRTFVFPAYSFLIMVCKISSTSFFDPVNNAPSFTIIVFQTSKTMQQISLSLKRNAKYIITAAPWRQRLNSSLGVYSSEKLLLLQTK